MAKDVALALLQLVALAVPPVAVLIKMLRHSDNISWTLRRVSFGLALGSLVFFLLAEAFVLTYLVRSFALPATIQSALVLILLGLVPFAAFTVVLYREHKLEFN